jgi:cytoskeletal protein CcmA (bactofilin family)
LLGIALNDRTIVVNGNVSGLLEVGGNTLVSKRFNLIAKGDIQFLGAVTGLVVNGVLFSQGDISIEGHAEVKGFIGARNIKIGGGLVSNLLGLVTGDMEFEYDAGKLNSLPQGIGFHADGVEVVEQGE